MMESEIQSLDWINTFEKKDKLYEDFYKEPLEIVKTVIAYIDKNNDIVSVKKLTIPLINGTLKKASLIDLLNENLHFNNIKYRPISIIKWNMNIEPSHIKDYFKGNVKEKYDDDFFTIESEIKDIIFNDSISILHDINTLYVFLHESWRSYNNRSKKIYINKLKRKNQTKRLKR